MDYKLFEINIYETIEINVAYHAINLWIEAEGHRFLEKFFLLHTVPLNNLKERDFRKLACQMNGWMRRYKSFCDPTLLEHGLFYIINQNLLHHPLQLDEVGYGSY